VHRGAGVLRERCCRALRLRLGERSNGCDRARRPEPALREIDRCRARRAGRAELVHDVDGRVGPVGRVTHAVADEVVAGIIDAEGGAVGERDRHRITPGVAEIARTEVVVERHRRRGCGGCRGTRGHRLTGERSASGAGQRGGHCTELRERDTGKCFQLLPFLSHPSTDNGKTDSET